MLTLSRGIRRWVVRPGVTLLTLAGIAMVTEAVLEYRERREAPAQGVLVDVGGGRRVYLDCVGSGLPVVVLASGLGDGAAGWGWIAPEVARETRVCTFDRAGRGWSDAAPAPQDGNAVAEDLSAALAGAGEVGPYLLVGHSFGGLYVRAFAARYAERTAGMVLLDTSDPQMFTRLPAYPGFYKWLRRASVLFPALSRLGVARLIGLHAYDDLPPAAAAEERRFGATVRQARSTRDEIAMAPVSMEQAGALVSLGDKPLMIVTALDGAQEGWTALQDELVGLSSNSGHWKVATATHQSLVYSETEAAISLRGIREVVAAVRSGGQLARH